MTTSVYDQLDALYHIEPRRLTRAKDICAEGKCEIDDAQSTTDMLVARVNYHHKVWMQLRPSVAVECTCRDWRVRGRNRSPKMACKHVIALALEADEREDLDDLVASPPANLDLHPPPRGEDGLTPFGQQVADTIAAAVETQAELVERLIDAGEVPFLLGPTGVAKTSSVREVATRNAWSFEEIAGSPSFADADLVGTKMQGGVRIPGPFARAFERARGGETVLLFLDEFTRFNRRAQDILMRPLLPTSRDVANAMNIPAKADVRLIEAPLWGVEWAPVEQVKIVIAANPWGSQIDPALVRRVYPVEVSFSEEAADLFEDDLAEAIRLSWKATRGGELPLPIEYGALTRAQGPDDSSILVRYFHRLRAVDQAGAEGYRTLLEGEGITLPEGV